MNNENEFPWNGSRLVRDEYEKDNYFIIETDADTNKAIVFFSSNGIYFPNTEDAFLRAMNGPRHGYEWTNIAKNKRVQRTFKKIMFIRDVYKQWYITGINDEVNSVEKVAMLASGDNRQSGSGENRQ